MSVGLLADFMLTLTLLLAAPAADADNNAAPAPIRVMTFNIRYGTADDGPNRWDRRKEFLVETIRTFDPDLLGTQETLKFQRDYLAVQLPGYAAIGVGRNDGRDDGEMAALYYRKERFEEVEHGHFWLSEHPEEPGSQSWDSSLPRIVTWVRLRDRSAPASNPLTFFNTHFDHIGTTARLESAKLLRTRIDTAAASGPVVVTGDFNCGEGSPPYAALFAATDSQPATVIDAFRRRHPKPAPDEGTFSGFAANQIAGPRIDWIGISPAWTVEAAEIDRTSRDGRTPSDHWPVTAIISRSE